MTEPELTDPSVYLHRVDERVRFSDTDAVGHVSNVALATGRSALVVVGPDGPAPIGDTARALLREELDR